MQLNSNHKKKENLFDLIKKGDEMAFELVFKEFYASLTAFAHTFLHDIYLSENIVQNVFIKLWEKRMQYEITSLKSYLFIAVRNSCNNELKRIKSERSYKNSLSQEEFIKSENYSDTRTLEEIINTIEKLPEQRKKIFKLSRLDGLKYREIADKLKISPKTVEVQMGKALKFLRENLLELKKQVYIILL